MNDTIQTHGIGGTMKSSFIAALALVLLGAAGLYVFSQRPSAPDVSFTTLNGETVTTTQLRGKVVLVNFWATTCTTCIKEMPHLVSTYEKFAPRGFETIAVAMEYDPPSQVKAYAERNALPFRVALDASGEVARGFNDVRLTPTTFLIDKRGKIVHKYLGEPDFNKLHTVLDQLLSEPA